MTLNFAATRGTVYFSFLLKVTDVSAVNSTGRENNYFAAFGDNVGEQDAALVRAATRVLAKKSGDGFKLGVGRNSNRPADWVFDDTERKVGDVLFVVGSYNYGEHTANLWIDPAQSSFGTARPPAPTVTARRGADLNRNGIRSFVLGCRTNNPPACIVDELRIGQSWSYVTGGKETGKGTEEAIKPVMAKIQRPIEDYHRYITNADVLAHRPNIIFILCDDMGYGDLGVLYQNSRAPGLPREKTPNLDAFAAEGMQLRQHYCPAPLCAPSRASLMLGVHQGHANVRDQQFDKALEDNHTIGTVLQAAGYATALIGKWGMGGDDEGGIRPSEWPAYPTRRGFDYFFGYERHGDGHDHYPKEAPYSNHSKQCYDGEKNITPMLDKCYTTDLFTARAKKWIVDQRRNHPDQPFFLYLAFDTPHSVYELPTQAYPAGGGLRGGLQWTGAPGHMINTASGKVDSYIYPDFASTSWPLVFQRFASGIRRIDDAVGDVKQLLTDMGIETNTLVIFTSDNGPTIEDATHLKPRYAANFFDNFGPLDGIKRDSFEGGIRMPTLVRWPGKIAAGTTNFTPSQFHDWMPTFADLAGLAAPARTDGVSLVPTLTGEGTQRPSTVYVEYFDPSKMPDYTEFEPAHRDRMRNQMQVIGMGGYQGVRYDVNSAWDKFEIYDVIHDLKEATNLAGEPALAHLQKEMQTRVLQLRRPNDSAPRPYDEEPVPPSEPVPVTNGFVNYSVYQGRWPWVPDADMLTSTGAGRVAGLSLEVHPSETDYAIDYTGYIQIPSGGEYTFYLDDDAGAVFRLHEATVIDDDFTHGHVNASGSIMLKAGLHAFRLTYLHRTGPARLSLQYSAKNQPKQPVPLTAFYADCPEGSIPATVNNTDAPGLPSRPALPEAPRNRPGIVWSSSDAVGHWKLLVHAGPAQFQASATWAKAPAAHPAGWGPLICSFDKEGKQIQAPGFFSASIDVFNIYNRPATRQDLTALFGGAAPSSRDWQQHYFASTPGDWMTDEDADGATLGCQTGDGTAFLADSPVMQVAEEITAQHPEIQFNRRMTGGGELAYEVQVSSDLSHWTPLNGTEVSVRPAAELPGFEKIVFRASAVDRPLYARVQLQ
jgi:arylsulfatase A-like enzyme